MPTSRERILAALKHETLDRIPICEQGIWPETIERWREEGLPANTTPRDYFGLDNMQNIHFADWGFFPHEIYEDNDEYCIDLNGQGTVVKWFKNGGSSSGHEELEHRVNSIDDWRKARERLDVSERRIQKLQPPEKDNFRFLHAIDHYWMSYTMLGMENLCCWLAGEQDWIKEVYDDYSDFLIGMLDLALEKNIDFDAVWFFSDMAFNTSPMFSPVAYREIIRPGYDKVRNWCDRNDKYLFLHTDGNLDILMPELIDTGFDLLHPLEARAGNDVRKIKEKYPDITLMGNINADIFAKGDFAEIEDEIASKITVAKEGGGYIYNIDHSVPPTISFEAYCHAINCIKKYGKYREDA